MNESRPIKNITLNIPVKVPQARFSRDNRYIIDSDGRKVDIDDPRVVIVEPSSRNPYGKRLVVRLYEKHNRKIRIADETDPDTIQYAKKICSGRECLPSFGIAGEMLKDIHENREPEEITIYRNPVNQHGPCQNGNWPLLWQNFADRLNLKDIICGVSSSKRNNYFGLGFDFAVFEFMLFLTGHILTELRNVLECTAENKDVAFNKFNEALDRLVDSFNDEKSFKKGLKDFVKEISKTPLKKSVSELPKVLIIGGLNLQFCHYPVEDYFLEQEIIPKVVDLSETMDWLSAERAYRYGFKRGKIHPNDQLKLFGILLSFFNNNQKEVREALKSIIRLSAFTRRARSYREIIAKSGLIFDKTPSFRHLADLSYEYLSHNGITEASVIAGRFIHAVETDVYDGIVNLGCFNCNPAMNSQAIIRPIANRSDIAYTALDVEGPWLSTNQRRLLETIAVRAKRIREIKNEKNA